jgi:hypothetical protein
MPMLISTKIPLQSSSFLESYTWHHTNAKLNNNNNNKMLILISPEALFPRDVRYTPNLINPLQSAAICKNPSNQKLKRHVIACMLQDAALYAKDTSELRVQSLVVKLKEYK